MIANKKPAAGSRQSAGSQQHSRANHFTPNATAARFKNSLSQKEAAAASGEYNDLLNYVEAMINSASCSSCAFHESKRCKAMPPHIFLINDLLKSEWPRVQSDDWCGSWSKA